MPTLCWLRIYRYSGGTAPPTRKVRKKASGPNQRIQQFHENSQNLLEILGISIFVFLHVSGSRCLSPCWLPSRQSPLGTLQELYISARLWNIWSTISSYPVKIEQLSPPGGGQPYTHIYMNLYFPFREKRQQYLQDLRLTATMDIGKSRRGLCHGNRLFLCFTDSRPSAGSLKRHRTTPLQYQAGAVWGFIDSRMPSALKRPAFRKPSQPIHTIR